MKSIMQPCRWIISMLATVAAFTSLLPVALIVAALHRAETKDIISSLFQLDIFAKLTGAAGNLLVTATTETVCNMEGLCFRLMNARCNSFILELQSDVSAAYTFMATVFLIILLLCLYVDVAPR